MLERLAVGDEESAKTRVAAQAIPARPLNRNGGVRIKGQSDGHRTGKGKGKGAADLTARIARDRPDIWERMKNGEFTSVAAAAREAGILVNNPKRVVLRDDVAVVAAALRQHYSEDQLKDLVNALDYHQ